MFNLHMTFLCQQFYKINQNILKHLLKNNFIVPQDTRWGWYAVATATNKYQQLQEDKQKCESQHLNLSIKVLFNFLWLLASQLRISIHLFD